MEEVFPRILSRTGFITNHIYHIKWLYYHIMWYLKTSKKALDYDIQILIIRETLKTRITPRSAAVYAVFALW